LALPLVRTHGFTRETLARSVLALPPGEAHPEPLSDTAVSALFGKGDNARRTLIDAWMKDGLRHLGTVPGVQRSTHIAIDDAARQTKKATLRDVLRARLEYNEPVLPHLPEVRYFLEILIHVYNFRVFRRWRYLFLQPQAFHP